MQRILLSMLLGVSLAGCVMAQEAAGKREDTAEGVKRELIKMEEEKVSSIRQRASDIADWFDRVNTDDLVYWDQSRGTLTKAQVVAEFRSGKRKGLSIHHYDYHVYVHGDGNTAVLTYRGNDSLRENGQVWTHENFTTDVFVKEDGAWRRIVHYMTFVP